ncbi:hypothetical protein [Sporomusa aerivorans]|uniref:type IV pilus modification PilV family protein n=1 Tax=Sporomusa aerivorans TaxID=204936 RepID=UPI00352A684A
MEKLSVRNGFIMAEVVLAVMITGIALLTIAGIFAQATLGNKNAAEYTAATNLAQKQLELLKRKPPSYWEDPSLPARLEWQDASETLPVNIKGVAYYVTTTASTSVEDSNLIETVVVVTWSHSEKIYKVALTAFYSKI